MGRARHSGDTGSTSAPAHPKPGTVLTEDSVKLLLPGDVLARVWSGSRVTLKRVVQRAGAPSDVLCNEDMPPFPPNHFTFHSRPSLEPPASDELSGISGELPPASDVAGWRPIEDLIGRLVAELAPDQGQRPLTAFGLALELQSLIKDMAPEEDDGDCPICSEQFKTGDRCSLDVDMGTCHAECLEGAPVADLDTGEPSDGPMFTFIYGSDESIPPPQASKEPAPHE